MDKLFFLYSGFFSIQKFFYYVKIDTKAHTEEIFSQSDHVNSDVEDDIDKVLPETYTEFYVEEGICNSSAATSTQNTTY